MIDKRQILVPQVADGKEPLSSLRLEAVGKLPAMEFRQLSSGKIMFRYAVGNMAEYPGFDGLWREMCEADIRDTLRIGGRVAEWLKSLNVEGK
jgi:hypothetical protein